MWGLVYCFESWNVISLDLYLVYVLLFVKVMWFVYVFVDVLVDVEKCVVMFDLWEKRDKYGDVVVVCGFRVVVCELVIVG